MQSEGFLLINKPAGMTSFACVSRIKRLFKKVKVGHSGTLDSFATGLLIIGIGRTATRMMNELLTEDKIYRAQGKLGELTDTFDPHGTLMRQAPITTTSVEQIAQALEHFKPSYQQVPPAYSALKYQGARLSTLAHQKVDTEKLQMILEAKRRTVYCYSLEVTQLNFPFFAISAHVSHGTYIRSLVNDIAQVLGSCATTVALQRTAIGPFKIEDAVPLEAMSSAQVVMEHMITVDEMKRMIQLQASDCR